MAGLGWRLGLLLAGPALAAACSQAASSPSPEAPGCPALAYIEHDACVPLVIGDGSVVTSDAGVDVAPAVTEAGDGPPLDAPTDTPPAGCPFTLTPSSMVLPTGAAPSSVVVGDFDFDGKKDMAATTAADELTIFSGNGGGTFSQGPVYSTGLQPGAIATGDFDRDGTPDIVVANSLGDDGGNGGTASVYLGSHDGGLSRQSQYPTGLDPTDLAISDVNLDARPDIVLSTKTGTSVLLGNGDGTFQAPLPSGSGYETAVVTGDMNGDGRPDIVTSQSSAYSVVVQLGNGDGTFASPIVHMVQGASPPASVLVADVNHDGNIDVMATNGAELLVLLGNGDGSLADPAIYALREPHIGVALGDMNGDGNVDLVATIDFGIGVMLGKSDGTFDTVRTFGLANEPSGIAIGDVNSDGKQDVVAADLANTMTVLFGACMR
jgi:hypothetical protein